MLQIFFVFIGILASAEPSLNFGPVIRVDSTSKSFCTNQTDGEVCGMTQAKAEVYCLTQNQRLPTALDYAKFAQSYGALGIADRYLSEEEAVNNEYHYIRYVNSQHNGYSDIRGFNYSSVGYNGTRDSDEVFITGMYWTSSKAPHSSNMAYIFAGLNGTIGQHCTCDCPMAVRCIAD